MRATAILMACTALASPAWAWETPKRVSPSSPVCTVPYNPDEGVQVPAEAGMTLTIELGDTREIKEVAVSDRAHLKSNKTDNVLWLKASAQMQPQPVSIRAERKDGGKSEIYVIEWVAADAAAGRSCDLVRFTYPRDAIEAKRAEQVQRRAAWEAGAASRALHAAASQPGGPQTAPSVLNRAYSISGSLALLPAQLASAVTAAVTPTPLQGATR